MSNDTSTPDTLPASTSSTEVPVRGAIIPQREDAGHGTSRMTPPRFHADRE